MSEGARASVRWRGCGRAQRRKRPLSKAPPSACAQRSRRAKRGANQSADPTPDRICYAAKRFVISAGCHRRLNQTGRWTGQSGRGIFNETMCGIVGILGHAPVAGSLVDSLKRLEYRGYDSAGVATLEGGHLTRRRAEGKLKNLEQRLLKEPLAGTSGIGHTRWATHGRPNETNAHPHATDKVAVVHNGIIENFAELREALEGNGATFSTETDTEVVAHLVSHEMEAGRSPAEAVAAALPRLRGAFALAFLFTGEEDLMIGARKGSPLAVGYGK